MQTHKAKKQVINNSYVEKEIENEKVKIKQLSEEIFGIYQDSEQQFIKSSISETTILGISDRVINIKADAQAFNIETNELNTEISLLSKKKQDLTAEIQKIKEKKQIQDKISRLLTVAPTDWSVENSVIIAQDATEETIQQVLEEVSSKEQSVWKSNMVAICNELILQVQYYNSLKDTIEKMKNDGVLSETATIDRVLVTYTQLLNIKNEVLKADLTTKLDEVYNQLQGDSNENSESLELNE